MQNDLARNLARPRRALIFFLLFLYWNRCMRCVTVTLLDCIGTHGLTELERSGLSTGRPELELQMLHEVIGQNESYPDLFHEDWNLAKQDWSTHRPGWTGSSARVETQLFKSGQWIRAFHLYSHIIRISLVPFHQLHISYHVIKSWQPYDVIMTLGMGPRFRYDSMPRLLSGEPRTGPRHYFRKFCNMTASRTQPHVLFTLCHVSRPR